MTVARLTLPRAALVAGLVALAVYGNAPRNRWALDDVGIILQNPAAHSVSAALAARFSPYWPVEEGHPAGLYRPAVIVSYAVDWSLSDGAPWWFHLHNMLLHALATALVVLVFAAWLPVAAALAAGLLFAVHPVHVEAVANVVGRAELLVAVGLLCAVLAFRNHRRAASRVAGAAWGAATVAAVVLALLSKEHAVVAVAVLALDAWLTPAGVRRRGLGVLAVVLVCTVAWFALWQAIAGPYVQGVVAPTVRHLSFGQRLATMLPVYLDVLRLLVWPLRLAYDYSPQVIPQRTGFTAVAALGALVSAALVALGLMSRRRAPAVAFGILVAVVAYAPTANLLFASGTVLGERSLYLPVLAPALAVAWLLVAVWGGRWRRVALVGFGALLAVYAVRTVTRTPFWMDGSTVLVESVLTQPENYRTRRQLAHQRALRGDSLGALADYQVAVELFDRDPAVARETVELAMALGRPRVALRTARRAAAAQPDDPAAIALLVGVYHALGWNDSALVAARAAAERRPGSVPIATMYLELHRELGSPGWQQDLARARLEWLSGRRAAAVAALDTALAALEGAGGVEGACWELRAASALSGGAASGWEQRLQRARRLSDRACGPN